MKLNKISEKYIKNTVREAIVANKRFLLGNLTNEVIKAIAIDDSNKSVYITSRCVKHWYDKKPAEEYDSIIKNLHEVIKYPDKIYKNLPGKRGDLCFLKRVGSEKYLCFIEISDIPTCDCNIIREIQVATAMRLRKENYIKKYTLLWDRGDDGSPS